MKRRKFLLAAGIAGSLGATRGWAASPDRPLAVKVWFDEAAAAYPSVGERVGGYVRRALVDAGREATVEHARSTLAFDGDRWTVMRRAWPRMVLSSLVGAGPVDPARDVNLLVTDDAVDGEWAGYASTNVAALGGARHLAAMPPVERTPGVVEPTLPAATAQLLLHECGHALGLAHRHGSLTTDGGTAIASPMVGAYPWATEAVRRRQFGFERSACGQPYPAVDSKRRRLGLRYGDCAGRQLARYRGGLLP